MKAWINLSSLLPALIAGFTLVLAERLPAQNFVTLYNFTGAGDGGAPNAGLILSGNTFYGTAASGGSSGHGTVFALNTDGTGFTNLYGFTGGEDGGDPDAGLILLNNTLYGTTAEGGISSHGTVFGVNTDGSGFNNPYLFTGVADGSNPYAALTSTGYTMYGTAIFGGSLDDGTLFAVNTDGTGFTNLHNFTDGRDGSRPADALVLSGNTLYGTAIYGGTSGNGTVYALYTDGTGFITLHSFAALASDTTNSDGALPNAGLLLSGNTLYGTASRGGSSGSGTVFAVNTDGTGFTNLHNFNAATDGANPNAALIMSGNTLFGTTVNGGSSSNGTVFAINTDGTGFMNLHSFTATSSQGVNNDGANPYGGLVLSGNNLYGTAVNGGTHGAGTVFSLTLAPLLTITRAGAKVVLSWPASVGGIDFSGFTLQSTTNLISPNWGGLFPPPVQVNGQETVTQSVTTAQMFYRLSQ